MSHKSVLLPQIGNPDFELAVEFTRWVCSANGQRTEKSEFRTPSGLADMEKTRSSLAVFRRYSPAELPLSWHNPLLARNPPRYLDRRYQGLYLIYWVFSAKQRLAGSW